MNSVIQKLKDIGYQTIDSSWYDRISDWNSWYKGAVEKFHNFTVWNGQRRVRCQRYSLGMGKKVCEDWANLLMNERVKVTLSDKKSQEFVNAVFKDNDFEVCMNELQEKGAAYGTYAIIPRVSGVVMDARGPVPGTGGKIVLDYLSAQNIYPLTWRGRNIAECAFSTTITQGNDTYKYLQIHAFESGEYVVYNRMFRSNTGAGDGTLTDAELSNVKGFENVPERITTHSASPGFVIGRYNIANNIDDNIPMGVSVFANAVDVLKGVDKAYDSYINEFDIGKKRIMVKPSAAKRPGNEEEVFDPDDLVFYVLPEDISGGTIIQPIDMSLRIAEHHEGLQDFLNLLSSKCGFGEKHYRFDQGSVATATQIISENSEMFRTIKKHEQILESTIVSLCRIILRMGNHYMSAGLNEDVEIKIDFDDSIIEDKQAESNEMAQRVSIALQMIDAGLMKPEEGRAFIMGEDVDTARKALPNTSDLMMRESPQAEVE